MSEQMAGTGAAAAAGGSGGGSWVAVVIALAVVGVLAGGAAALLLRDDDETAAAVAALGEAVFTTDCPDGEVNGSLEPGERVFVIATDGSGRYVAIRTASGQRWVDASSLRPDVAFDDLALPVVACGSTDLLVLEGAEGTMVVPPTTTPPPDGLSTTTSTLVPTTSTTGASPPTSDGQTQSTLPGVPTISGLNASPVEIRLEGCAPDRSLVRGRVNQADIIDDMRATWRFADPGLGTTPNPLTVEWSADGEFARNLFIGVGPLPNPWAGSGASTHFGEETPVIVRVEVDDVHGRTVWAEESLLLQWCLP